MTHWDSQASKLESTKISIAALKQRQIMERAIQRNSRCGASALPGIVGLQYEEIRELIEHGVFPPADCGPDYGPTWEIAAVRRWAAALRYSPELADQVEAILGYCAN